MDLGEVIQAIGRVRNEMVKQNAIDNPVVLSELMMKLAQLCHLVADSLADSILTARQLRAQKFYEFKKEVSANQAEILTRFDPEIIQAEADANKLELAVKSTNNLISVCQSHLRVKLNELSQTGL